MGAELTELGYLVLLKIRTRNVVVLTAQKCFFNICISQALEASAHGDSDIRCLTYRDSIHLYGQCSFVCTYFCSMTKVRPKDIVFWLSHKKELWASLHLKGTGACEHCFDSDACLGTNGTPYKLHPIRETLTMVFAFFPSWPTDFRLCYFLTVCF